MAGRREQPYAASLNTTPAAIQACVFDRYKQQREQEGFTVIVYVQLLQTAALKRDVFVQKVEKFLSHILPVLFSVNCHQTVTFARTVFSFGGECSTLKGFSYHGVTFLLVLFSEFPGLFHKIHQSGEHGNVTRL